MKTKKLVCYNCGGHGFITSTYENGQTSAICPVCGGIGSHEIQMTNADRIRAMTDEDLADFLAYTWATSARAWQKDTGETLHWLKQRSEGE